jgi:CheY-like chemotaxis protein
MAMPEMTGGMVLEELQAEGTIVPVIIMTASPLRYRWPRERVAAILLKPFDLDELRDLVTAVLLPQR